MLKNEFDYWKKKQEILTNYQSTSNQQEILLLRNLIKKYQNTIDYHLKHKKK
jgi:hypothetical protein